MSRLAVVDRAEREGQLVSAAVEVPAGERFITVRIPIDGWARREGETAREREVIEVAVQWSADSFVWNHFFGGASGGFPTRPNRRGDFHPDVALRPDFPLPETARFVRTVVDCRLRLMLKVDIDTAATYEGAML